MLNNIFDSHAHYADSAFDNDRERLLKSLPQKCVSGIVTVGSNMEDSYKCVEIAEAYDYAYAACGVHPESESFTSDGYLSGLEKLLSSSHKIKALGEIGLDYHYENYNRERQIKLFEEQLELAEALGLPVIIHSRDAFGDTMEILRKYRPKGVMHCFSGSPEIAAEVISLGMYISFTGVLTFKNAKKALRALEEVPMEKLMLETDCPYMAPEPYRGKRCDSSMIERTALKAAEIKGASPQEILDVTYKNSLEFFEI
ncbi:TatD family hydrolase [Ruminococcus sp. 25CYCFAH16]